MIRQGRSELIRRLFDDVIGLEPEERAAHLAEACGSDEDLRREVESLLAAADARGSGVRRALEELQPSGEADHEEPATGEIAAALQAALADRYLIVREIGRGGMATVYLADDLKHPRQVAIKVMDPDLSEALGAERFLGEIETASSLTHPHILPLYDSGEAEGLLYYVMPFVEGESLRHRLKREKQLPVEDAVRIAQEVAGALQYAHGRGVIHRDVKPANILLEAGHAVLADFGIAKAVSEVDRTHLTQRGTSLGTPVYMSPEQTSGEQKLDGRSDQYTLGCVLYEMLAGQPPHPGPNLAAIVAKMMAGPAPSVRKLRSDAPEAVERALAVALERKPEDRHATAAEFGAALAGTAPRMPKGRWLPWAATVAMATVVTVAWYVGANQSGAPSTDGGRELSANRIVVLPFTVRGNEELELWEEGMAMLLADALDGAGDLTTVDSRAVLGFMERTNPGPLSPELARDIAARFGAGSFILGDALAGGGRISVRASLYGVSGDPQKTADADVADEEQIPEMVDEVARQLVLGHADNAGDRLTRIGAATTHSLPALKAYLRGEALFRSAFFMAGARSALAEYRQAVEADTTFALAYFRMALLKDYVLESLDVGDAADFARRFSDRLPPQEQRLLECYSAIERADGGAAERWCRQVTDRNSNNADAWYLLGEALQHYGLRRGRPIDEVRAAYNRALALEPSQLYWGPLSHRAWIAIVEEDFDGWAEYRESIAQMTSLQPSSRVYQLAVDAFRGDESALDQMITAMGNSSASDIWAVDTYPIQNREATIRVLRGITAADQSRARRAEGHLLIAQEELTAGRMSAAREELAQAKSLDAHGSLIPRAYLLLSPYLETTTRDDLSVVREEVAGWSPAEPSDRVWRLYLLGLLDERLDDPTGAARYASELDSFPVEWTDGNAAQAGALAEDLARYLNARLSFRQERYQEAWRVLQQTEPERWWPVIDFVRAHLKQLYERWLTADVLVALDRGEEALNWLGGLGMDGERTYMGIRHFRMAEIYEELGNGEKATYHYGRFVTYWKDADDELQPRVEEAKRRIEALSAER